MICLLIYNYIEFNLINNKSNLRSLPNSLIYKNILCRYYPRYSKIKFNYHEMLMSVIFKINIKLFLKVVVSTVSVQVVVKQCKLFEKYWKNEKY